MAAATRLSVLDAAPRVAFQESRSSRAAVPSSSLRGSSSVSGGSRAFLAGSADLRSMKLRARVVSRAAGRNVVRAAVMEPSASPDSRPENENGQEVANGWMRQWKGKWEQGYKLWSSCREPGVAAQQPPEMWSGIRPVHKVMFSDVLASPKRGAFLKERTWSPLDFKYTAFIVAMHIGAFMAPFYFTWSAFAGFLAMYFVTGCIGITYSYHRQLSHKSFQSPKWLEWLAAYCGALAIQGDPIEWVSSHRYHHMHTDTPLDPHTPYEGFWWSHAGWLLDNEATLDRVADRSNAVDMAKDPFYQWLLKSYNWHVVGSGAAIFLLGGLPMFLWAYCFRTCWVWHITWFVNSASHVWGNQQYNTGDLSRNNWWVGILAFGEGWHNNHHAFEFSARHGLDWWQVDVTWGVISVLKALGLVSKVKLPSQTQLDKLRLPEVVRG